MPDSRSEPRLSNAERKAYCQGVEDARAQIMAALIAESGMGYVEGSGIARACDVIENLPRPEVSRAS